MRSRCTVLRCGFALAFVLAGAGNTAAGVDTLVGAGSGSNLLPLSPEAAYEKIARIGELSDVRVEGDLDLARLRPPSAVRVLSLRDVQIDGTLVLRRDGPAVDLLFDHVTLNKLDLRGARLRGALTFTSCAVQGLARFDDAQFDGPFTMEGCELSARAVFRHARFYAPVEIFATRFHHSPGGSGGATFADARFDAPARFDRSRFGHNSSDARIDAPARSDSSNLHLSFESARFAADATFLGLVVEGEANFRNVWFGGDAEFRFCRLGDVDFGDTEQMSVFSGLADFRGCTARSVSFDYADMRGSTMLVSMQVDPGDLTLRQALLRGERSDFSGLQVAGRLDLEGAHIPAMFFRWPEIKSPVLRAKPRTGVLQRLHRRLAELGLDDEAREVSAVLATQQMYEQLERPETGIAERARLRIEWLVWGWPTGYGTQLGRIAFLTLIAWLLMSAPLLRLSVAPLVGSLDTAPPRHQPVPAQGIPAAPAGFWQAWIMPLIYSFGLTFAIPRLRLRPVEPLRVWVQPYLLLMRGVGALLLALLTLTLAKVSPVFQALLGNVG